jgi:hypothetical protein
MLYWEGWSSVLTNSRLCSMYKSFWSSAIRILKVHGAKMECVRSQSQYIDKMCWDVHM